MPPKAAINCGGAATITLGAKGAVKLKNPPAVRPVNLKNLPTLNPHAAGVSQGRVPYKISFPLLTLQKFYTTIVVNYQMPYREIPPIEP